MLRICVVVLSCLLASPALPADPMPPEPTPNPRGFPARLSCSPRSSSKSPLTCRQERLSQPSHSIRLPDDLLPGSYTLSVAVVGEGNSEPVVQLGIEGRFKDGWNPLSTVTVNR